MTSFTSFDTADFIYSGYKKFEINDTAQRAFEKTMDKLCETYWTNFVYDPQNLTKLPHKVQMLINEVNATKGKQTPYGYLFTCSPKDFHTANNLETIILKITSKTWVTQYAYSVEQADCKERLHFHIFLLSNGTVPSNARRELNSSTRKLGKCNNNLKYIKLCDHQKVLDYVLKSPYKNHSQNTFPKIVENLEKNKKNIIKIKQNASCLSSTSTSPISETTQPRSPRPCSKLSNFSPISLESDSED